MSYGGGFGCISLARRRAISRLGGLARARKGVGHRFTHDEAVIAGRKGGNVNRNVIRFWSQAAATEAVVLGKVPAPKSKPT